MLAGRRLVLAALHADRLAQRDGRPGIAGFALAVDPLVVVAHVQGGRLGGKAARVRRVDQRGDVVGLMAPGRLDAPRTGRSVPAQTAAWPRYANLGPAKWLALVVGEAGGEVITAQRATEDRGTLRG
jgi:hypothetical protein